MFIARSRLIPGQPHFRSRRHCRRRRFSSFRRISAADSQAMPFAEQISHADTAADMSRVSSPRPRLSRFILQRRTLRHFRYAFMLAIFEPG